MIFVLLFLFLLGACTKDTSSEGSNKVKEELRNEIEALNNEINNYKTQLETQEQTNLELNQEIEDYINQIDELSNAKERQGAIVSILNEISKNHLPEQYKQAFIKEIKENHSSYTFVVDYASWEHRDEAPNGGEIVNEEEELVEVEVDKNTFIYVIDSSLLSYRTTEEFMNSWEEEGIYQFFYYDDKVVLITQVLLP